MEQLVEAISGPDVLGMAGNNDSAEIPSFLLPQEPNTHSDQRLNNANYKSRSHLQHNETQPDQLDSVIEMYTIGWICALKEEYQAACHMLDDDELKPPEIMRPTNDKNTYVFGRLGGHYIVVGCLPMGHIGKVTAATVAADMIRSFPSLKFALMVGIGGGAPVLAKKRDIRLGDVVVSVPENGLPGVVQYDFGRRLPNGIFERIGSLNNPPRELLAAIQEVARLQGNLKKPDRIAEHIARMDHMEDYECPKVDRLYRADYPHKDQEVNFEDELEENCRNCGGEGLINRRERKSPRKVTVHYGTIASGDTAMKDAISRDQHSRDPKLNILCFEMEAAGLMNSLPCMVIRGICDYADSHKNGDWHNYAALVAAAYARELLLVLQPQNVLLMPSWVIKIDQLGERIDVISKTIEKSEQERKVESQRDAEEREAAQVHRENDKNWKIQQTRRQTNETLMAFKKSIEVQDSLNSSTYKEAIDHRCKGTCKWLLARQAFKLWMNKDCNYPILWLNGKHGSGKTYLCASAFEYIESLTQGFQAVAHRFLKSDIYIPRNLLLRSLAEQIICYIIKMAKDDIPHFIEPFLTMNKDDCVKLESLIHHMLMELPLTYIFIDGLDEVEYRRDQTSSHTIHQEKAGQEVSDFVSFLLQEALQFPSKVRLWCSSQPLPRIRQDLCRAEWKHAIREISLIPKDTEEDIRTYLSSKFDTSTIERDSAVSRLVKTAISPEVEGSFLWANLMIDDLKNRAEDEEDLLKLMNKGLPLRLSELYAKIIVRIKERDGGMKDPPLWKIVLSLLVFAKRPLKVTEIIEAIALIRTTRGDDLRQNNIVNDDKVLGSCMSLVQSNKIGNSQYILRLSHTALRTFLLEDCDTIATDGGKHQPVVTNQIIRDCCLNCLSQPRYSKLLIKVDSNKFQTHNRKDLRSQQFYLYAAKYWYQHFDLPSITSLTENMSALCSAPSGNDRAIVKEFLKSSNFQTCIQIQSLYIIGHFMQNFDLITDQGRSLRRTLPNWIPTAEPELNRQYLRFQSEWYRLLLVGPSKKSSGEIDRCFWGALGPENFLSRNTSRYQSFEFYQENESRKKDDSCRIQWVSSDGKQLLVCWVCSKDDPEQLRLELWTFDGVNLPRIIEQATIKFPAKDTCLSHCVLPCSQSFYSMPLIPRVDSFIPTDAISACLDGPVIRIGSKIFTRNSGGTFNTGFHELEIESLRGLWEEVCIREPFLVVCRRRKPIKRYKGVDKEKESRRIQAMKDRISAIKDRDLLRSKCRSRSQSPTRYFPHEVEADTHYQSDYDYDSSSELLCDANADSFGSSLYLALTSTDESWREDSSSTLDRYTSDDCVSSYELEEPQSDEDDSLDLISQNSEISASRTNSTFNGKPDNGQVASDSASAKSIISVAALIDETGTKSRNFEIKSNSSEDSKSNARPAEINVLLTYQPRIGREKYVIKCCTCGKDKLDQWYHCTMCSHITGSRGLCNDALFNFCQTCIRRKRWCLDLSHQLYRIVNRKPVDVISRQNLEVRQELAIYRMDNDKSGIVQFRYRKKYADVLYNSPPVIHPQNSLVVWALNGSRLLFADFKTSEHFEHEIINKERKKAHPICVNISFSPCGTFLRIAIIDVVEERLKQSRKAALGQTNSANPKICFNLCVMMFNLSLNRPTRDPPQCIALNNYRLGCLGIRPFVQNIPFAFTWRTTQLYLTISDVYLRVYRVIFPEVQRPEQVHPSLGDKEGVKFRVEIPKETVFLPRSSCNRSVQLFPPENGGRSYTVIIGPQYGRQPATPPIGVYLSEQDLGGWTDFKEEENEDHDLFRIRMRFADEVEDFDVDQDCDIIPFDEG